MTTLPSPANTLEVALSLARVGWPVFPVRLVERDGHREKKPLVQWLTEATTDPETIATWWSGKFSRAWIGVHCGRARLIVGDVDEGNGKHGADNLASAGIAIPPTFNYETGRAGRHHLFKAPAGEYTVAQNTPVRDVDIRAGHGLFVYYGPELTEAPTLAPAPAWALVPRERAAVSTGTSVEAWASSCKPGKPGAKLQALVRQVKPEGVGHEDMLRITREMVKLGTLGKAGAVEALAEARERYLENYPSFASAWDKAVEGSVDNWGPRRDLDTLTQAAADRDDDVVELYELAKADPDAEEDDDFEEDVAERMRTLEVDQEARRRIVAKNYTGTEALSWEDLEHHEVKWLVDGLVAESSLTYLVARANTGKTFAFIDMVCKMALGETWLGKTTRPAKTLIVLGEGVHGLIDRFRAWCEHHGRDLDAEIKPWVSFAGGANINNDESLTRLREMAADAELVILDTYAATSGVEKEDDAALQSITLNRARSINPSAALFFTHHPRKADEDGQRPVMRGSGAMAGAADAVITMFRDIGYNSTDPTLREKWLAISTEAEHAGKNRNAATETFRGLYLQEVGDSAALVQAAGEALTKADKIIRRFLAPMMTVVEFQAAAGLSRPTAAKYLRESHYVITHPGGGPNPARYSPTPNMLLQQQSADAYEFPEVDEIQPRKDVDE